MGRRSHRPTKGRACDGKQRHASREAGWKAIQTLVVRRGADPDQYHAYPCGSCGFWHTGHRRNTRGKR